jgi:hypothetical protein
MKLRYACLTQHNDSFLHGASVIELVLGGQLDCTILDLIKLIQYAVTEYGLKTVRVVIDGRVPAEREADDVAEFVQICQSKGYYVIGKSAGHVYPRWLPMCNYVIAMVTNDEWLNYGVNEIEYVPPTDGELKEPIIEKHNAGAIKTLLPSYAVPSVIMINFQRLAMYEWNFVSFPKYSWVVMLARES